ncbi:NAD+ kinase [Powellomyces hirtus]|uniref:NAD+ kinase n=1 Tax=Powellomyces hirtus TaxID=109895 RepID=A0A507DZE4_9FUNG|nr:NAD+ kinase [Powellomyces hirtus]
MPSDNHCPEPLQLRLSHQDYARYVIHDKSDPPTYNDIIEAFEKEFAEFNRKLYGVEFHDGEGFVELQDSPEQIAIFYEHISLDESTSPRRRKVVLRSRQNTPEHLKRDVISVDAIVDAAVCLHEKLGKVLKMKLRVEQCKSVLIVTKPQDPSIVPLTRKLAIWFLNNHSSDVYVNDHMETNPDFAYADMISSECVGHLAESRLKFWTAGWVKEHSREIGLVVTMGGDGTVLYAAGLFQQAVPPVVTFHLGSLGFLTNFQFEEYPKALAQIMSGHGSPTTFRQRLDCTLYKSHEEAPRSSHSSRILVCKRHLISRTENGCITCEMPPTGPPDFNTQVMNELVLDRGANAGLLMLELYADDMYLTTIQADGLVIATATGSTAYSLSAGGSLVYPEKTALLITPICPHTLTCRPMILPSRVRLRVCVSPNSRVPAWVSFDGRDRMELQKTDSVIITASRYPLLQICHGDRKDDWFRSLVSSLHWNEREGQKPLL